MTDPIEIGDMWTYNFEFNTTVYLILSEYSVSEYTADSAFSRRDKVVYFNVLDLMKNEKFPVPETAFKSSRWRKEV